MSGVPISPTMLHAIAASSFGRNKQLASVQAQNTIVAGYNAAARYGTPRQLFRFGGNVESIMASSVTNPLVVARGYAHTGAFCKEVKYSLVLAKPTAAVGASDPYAQIDVQTTGGVSLGTGAGHYGSFTGTPADTPDEWQEFTGTITVAASTTIAFVLSAYNNARIIGCTVWERSLDPDTSNNYMLGVVNTSPIFDIDRQTIVTWLATMILNNGGTQVDLGDVTRTTISATDTNLIDGTSTTVSASSPGITLDLRYKARRSKASTGVTMTLAIYGSCAVGSNGTVHLKDSGGSTLVTIGPFSTTPSWHVSTVTLPATLAKYDLMIATAASTLMVNFVALFE